MVARRCDVIYYDDVSNAKFNQSEATKGAKVGIITTSGKVFELGQKWLYSGKVVVFWSKVVLFGQSCSIRAKEVVYKQKWLYSGKSCFIRANVVLFGQSDCIPSKVVVFGQGGCGRVKVLVFG